MNKERIDNYNEHAVFLVEIAREILRKNEKVLNIFGVKEIIVLYLLILYMTPDKLDTPDNQ